MAKEIPSSKRVAKAVPEVTDTTPPIPEATNKVIPNPPVGNVNDMVMIAGQEIYIKPTKLKYQRDRTALFYHVLDVYPLPDILAADKEVFDKERDGDKCLFDWLIAATDDEKLISENYDDLDSETIFKIHEIFKRVNGITEKEEKNRKAKETRA